MSIIRRHFFLPLQQLLATALAIALVSTVGSIAHAAPFAYLADRALNNFSVIDMATFLPTVTTSFGAGFASPVNVVANRATGKVYIGKPNSIAILSAETNAVIGDIPLATGPLLSTYGTESQSLAVTNNGKKAYALTAGLVSVIDLSLKSVVATIAVPAASGGMALDEDGETLYVSVGNFSVTATPGIVIIDTLINEIDSVVNTGTLVPLHIAMHPDDNHLYLVGFRNAAPSNLGYSVLDPATATLSEVVVVPPPGIPHIGQFNNFVFNADGSRIYLAPQTLDMTTIPVLEINTSNGSVTRVLSIPSGFADQHDFVKMAASFVGGKFTLVFFIAEHLHHYPSEPPRRVVFVDGISGTMVKQLVYPSPFDNSAIVGDIFDVAAKPVSIKVITTTTLRASTNLPLRSTIPLTFDAIVAGSAPTGQVVFLFAALPQRSGHRTTHPVIVKVPGALINGMASLTLPACNAPWPNLRLHGVVCSGHFDVLARYRGDVHNKQSTSASLAETR